MSKGSYCVVLDTVIDDLPSPPDRSWGPGTVKSAVFKYLETDSSFEIDKEIEDKIL